LTVSVFLLVLCAAFLHAVWNAVVKGGADKSLNMSAVVVGLGLFGGLSLLVVPAPAPVSWWLIIVSVGLHYGYQEFLMASYRAGDLTQVYPIARGTAPMLVALVSVLALAEHLRPAELLAVAMIGTGIASLSFLRQRDGLRNGRAALLALATGCFIASYSLVDGIGARASGSPIGFFGWLALINGVVYVAVSARIRPGVIARLPRVWPVIVFGGFASFTAYALVVHAFALAPIALVTALRETSVVFALFIGVLFLKERLDPVKALSTVVTLAGVVVLRIG